LERRTATIREYLWISRGQSFVLIVLFCLALAVPLLGWLMGWQGVRLSENRHLAPTPDFSNTQLKDLPARIDSYLIDHVGFRGAMIRALSLFQHRFLKQSSSEVIIGESAAPNHAPWYFYASEGIIEDRLALNSLTTAQLEAWKNMLKARTAWLKRRGIAYLFVIVPEKSSVYPELLPDYIQNQTGPAKLDQLSRYLKETSSEAAFLDLRATLRDAKPKATLYFPYDTHWNGHGFFRGYEAMMSAVRTFFPDLTPGKMGEDFEIRNGPDSFRTDLAGMLGLTASAPTPLFANRRPNAPKSIPARWPDGFDASINRNDGVYALETPGQHRRLLVFHDSFFIAPLFSRESQPLAAHFGRSYFAWLSPTDAAVKRFVEMEQPDLVVEEHAERVLGVVPPPPPPLDPITPRLARSSVVPVFSIERINTRRARSGEVITPDGELRIEGWAFDGSAKRSAGGVEVLIDGIPQPASYGLERPQQARIPSCSACEHAGFVADFSAAGLSPGPHALGIRVISSDGASYSEANWGSITIGK
jgi:alginate O-acetyltransferase complex protein AlgJ